MKFHTVEWSRSVARIHSQLKPSITHIILPDLPEVDLNESAFFEISSRKIVTIAAGNHLTLESFDKKLQQYEGDDDIDKFLIVGGNRKDGITTLSAIERAKSQVTADVWCVANPNDANSIINVKDKLLAGADGLVTQPLLTSYAHDILNLYPTTATTLAGVAVPKTQRSLLFWLKLLQQPQIEHDEAFQASLEHFQSNKSPLEWVQSQIAMLPQELDGIHYMPISNTDILMDLLVGEQE